MFTTTDLRDTLLNSIAPSALPVRAVARFDLIALPADAEFFDALIQDGDPDGKMNLAIFLDARAVADDASLLDQARSHTVHMVRGSDSFLARMASAIDQFAESATGFWGRLSSLQINKTDTFDLNRIDTFPIVHAR